MKLVKALSLLSTILLLTAGLAQASDDTSAAIAIAPTASAVAAPSLDLPTDEGAAACAVQEDSPLMNSVQKELAAAGGGGGGSCNYCSSSSQCQPICGGQAGWDFACHFSPYCEFGRVCICFP